MRIGIDLGGSKIEGIIMGADSAILQRERVTTPQGDYTATLTAIVELVRKLERSAGQDGLSVGLGHPGSVSPTSGLMRNSNSVCLNGKPFQRDLEAQLGREIRMANDANCLALSEASDGAAAGAKNVFAVILGTGVGGGIVINGESVVGVNGIGGEWGHNPLPWPRPEWGEVPGLASAARGAPHRPATDGRAGGSEDDEGLAMDGSDTVSTGTTCWCGQQSCIETWLSGPGMVADHLRVTQEKISSEEIVARADAGDEKCGATLARYEDRLARALAQMINLLDPEVIVLGGGLSRVQRLYRYVPALWDQWIFSDSIATRLLPALHGDSSGVRGAAWLWPETRGLG